MDSSFSGCTLQGLFNPSESEGQEAKYWLVINYEYKWIASITIKGRNLSFFLTDSEWDGKLPLQDEELYFKNSAIYIMK